MSTFTLLAIAALAAGALGDSVTTANPVATAAPGKFLGYRNSSNTQSIRDLGFMGKLGDTWILSFGDATGTQNINDYDPNNNGGVCQTLTGRDGGGIQGDDPLSYSDISVTTEYCNGTPEMAYWCPLVAGDDAFEGLGITNVIDINGTHGAIWTRPVVSSSSLETTGAGLALVTFDSNNVPQCTRPFGKSTWGSDEPTWGQLGAITASDGYTYVYANGYNASGSPINTVVAARVQTENVFDLGSYRYYQGNGQWSTDRIHISDLSEDGPQNLGFIAGQGSIFYSNYYNRYIYITNGQGLYDGDSIYQFYAVAGESPVGPWSNRVQLYSYDPSNSEPKTNFLQSSYGGFVMPKFFSDDGKTIYFSYTRAAYFEGVVEVVRTCNCIEYIDGR